MIVAVDIVTCNRHAPFMPIRSFTSIQFSGGDGAAPEASGLRRFRTVAFDAGVMKQTIRFERAGVLHFGDWIEGVVPTCYQARVREIVTDVFNKSFRGRPYLPPHMMDVIIYELRQEIWRSLEPIYP